MSATTTTITLHPTLQIQGGTTLSTHSSSPDKTVVTTTSDTGYSYGSTKTSVKRERDSNDDGSPELMRCKRRINFAQLGYNLPQAAPSSVSRRNERERNRVKLVNLGFATLREHVPNGAKNKKMSKVETLRSAVEYIRKLQELIDDNEGGSSYGGSTTDLSNNTLGENAAPAHVGLHHHHQQSANGCYNGVGRTGLTCPPSSVSPTCSVASSPTPSYTSEYSYEPLSPEEEDLLDFTSWFS